MGNVELDVSTAYMKNTWGCLIWIWDSDYILLMNFLNTAEMQLILQHSHPVILAHLLSMLRFSRSGYWANALNIHFCILIWSYETEVEENFSYALKLIWHFFLNRIDHKRKAKQSRLYSIFWLSPNVIKPPTWVLAKITSNSFHYMHIKHGLVTRIINHRPRFRVVSIVSRKEAHGKTLDRSLFYVLCMGKSKQSMVHGILTIVQSYTVEVY